MTIFIKIVRNNATNWFESFSFDTENIGNATGFNNMTFFLEKWSKTKKKLPDISNKLKWKFALGLPPFGSTPLWPTHLWAQRGLGPR